MTHHTESSTTSAGHTVLAVVAWLWVLIPFLYGVYSLVVKIPALFGGSGAHAPCPGSCPMPSRHTR
jgi:hypothetical protein